MTYTKEQIIEWAKRGQAISPSVVLELMEYYEKQLEEADIEYKALRNKICSKID